MNALRDVVTVVRSVPSGIRAIGRATGAGLLTDHINADSFDDGDITIGDNGITVTRWRTEREVKP